MPLPVAHSLMGYTLYEITAQKQRRRSWRTLLLFVGLALLPDIDFLPGYLMGKPNLYHHTYTHTLGFAVLVGVVVATGFYLKERRGWWTYFAIGGGACFSHMLLDFVTADFSRPYGLPILWPFSEAYYISPVKIFLSANKSGDSATFWRSLFVWHNLKVALWELAVFVPVLVWLWWRRRGQRPGLAIGPKRLRRSADAVPTQE